MTASSEMPGAGTPGDDDVRRRIRFDADADMRLLQAVLKREPFAADHGLKLKAWDEVADEVYATAAKLRDVPSSRRAVSDRFHHLLTRYEQGNLKLKRWTDTPGGDEKAVAVQSMFRQIAARMAEIKDKKGKRQSRSSLSSLADAIPDSRKRGAPSTEDNSSDTATERDATSSERADTTTAEMAATQNSYESSVSTTSTPIRPSSRRVVTTPRDSAPMHLDDALSTEILALKREKLALKRQKLELLAQQHEDRMALERRRLELEEKRLEEARLARRAAAAAASSGSL